MHHRLCALLLLSLPALACSLDRGGIAAPPGPCGDSACAPSSDGGSPHDVLTGDGGSLIDPPALDAGAPPPADACGDGACAPDESCDACAIDCGTCPPPPPVDATPPSFEGADRVDAVSRRECMVEWRAASDESTPSDAIVYEIHVTPRGTAFDFTAPAAITAPGATSHVLAVGTGRVEIVVRAVDAAGNRDANERKRACDPR